MIILPRQAWDKHRENSEKMPFFAPAAGSPSRNISRRPINVRSKPNRSLSPMLLVSIWLCPTRFAAASLTVKSRQSVAQGGFTRAKPGSPCTEWTCEKTALFGVFPMFVPSLSL